MTGARIGLLIQSWRDFPTRLHAAGSQGIESLMAGGNHPTGSALPFHGTLVPTMARPETFEEFFDAERDRLFRVLCFITGNRHEAEEIAQDAFLALWERWDRLEDVSDLPGYLHRSAINCFRKRYRRSRVMLRGLAGGRSTTEVFEAVDARVAVTRALRNLAPRQRAAIVLTELLGFTAEEAGRELGIQASTVRALAFQARSALRASGRLSDE